MLFPWSKFFPEYLTERIIRHMSIMERLLNEGQSSRFLVQRMINILKEVEEKYSRTRTFIVVGHSLGEDPYEEMILTTLFCFIAINRRWYD